MILTRQNGNTLNVIDQLDDATPSGPNEVFQSPNITTGLVSFVVLPADYTDYDFIHVVEIVTGEPNEWRHTTLSVPMLTSGDIQANDNVRIQGNSDMSWSLSSRTLSIVGTGERLWRISMFKV